MTKLPYGSLDKSAERVYKGECMGSNPVDQPQEKCKDSMNEYLKRTINMGKGRTVHNKNEWSEFRRGECLALTSENEPLNLVRYPIYTTRHK